MLLLVDNNMEVQPEMNAQHEEFTSDNPNALAAETSLEQVYLVPRVRSRINIVSDITIILHRSGQ